jgi:hypothetical protein
MLGMFDPHRHHVVAPPRAGESGSHLNSRWETITDWLGAQKPLNLILGAVTIIAVVAMLVQLG